MAYREDRTAEIIGMAMVLVATIAFAIGWVTRDDPGKKPPIVIAGGKKRPERDALQMAYDACQEGASGVDMGRNIFQADDQKFGWYLFYLQLDNLLSLLILLYPPAVSRK